MPALPPQRRLLQWLVIAALIPCVIVISFVTALGCWALLVSNLTVLGLRFGQTNPVLVGAGLVLVLISGLALHEGAHLLAAFALRLRVERFVFGPFSAVCEGQRLVWRLNTDLVAPAMSIEAWPVDGANVQHRWAIYILAGPLANFLVGVLCVFGSVVTKQVAQPPLHEDMFSFWKGPWFLAPQSAAGPWLNFLSLWNLILCMGSLFPFRKDESDGRWLWALLFDGPGTARVVLLRSLYVAYAQGLRPAQWDGILLENLLARRAGDATDAYTNLFAYYRALDMGKMDDAGELLDITLGQLPSPSDLATAICLEGAFFEGCYRRHAAEARSLLEKAKGGQAGVPTWLRAEAAILLAEGYHAGAIAKAQMALAQVPRASTAHGGNIAEQDWLNALIATCRKDSSRDSPGPVDDSTGYPGRSFVRVIDAPPGGPEPEEVRRAWIGLTLPLAPGDTGPRKMRLGSVASPLRARLRRILLGPEPKTPQYCVLVDEALALLQAAAPQASTWWQTNQPELIGSGSVFAFGPPACEFLRSDRT